MRDGILSFLLASASTAMLSVPLTAQAPSKWCEYQPRSLTSVTSLNDSAGPGGDLVVSGEQFPTRARLQFVDSIRPVDSLERHFLNGYWTFLGRVYMDTLFSETALFLDDSSHRAYWVPVQITMLASLRTELQGGDTLTGFMLWAGKYKRVDHQYRNVFLLNEFTSPKSAEYWRSELSTCVSGQDEVFSVDVVQVKPELLSVPQLEYPDLLKKAGIQGVVTVQAIIDTAGRVEQNSVRVVSSANPGFDSSARDYVLKGRYRPARVYGHTVRVLVQVPVNFTLNAH